MPDTNQTNIKITVRERKVVSKYTRRDAKNKFFKAFYNLKILVHLLMIISTGSLWFSSKLMIIAELWSTINLKFKVNFKKSIN